MDGVARDFGSQSQCYKKQLVGCNLLSRVHACSALQSLRGATLRANHNKNKITRLGVYTTSLRARFGFIAQIVARDTFQSTCQPGRVWTSRRLRPIGLQQYILRLLLPAAVEHKQPLESIPPACALTASTRKDDCSNRQVCRQPVSQETHEGLREQESREWRCTCASCLPAFFFYFPRRSSR